MRVPCGFTGAEEPPEVSGDHPSLSAVDGMAGLDHSGEGLGAGGVVYKRGDAPPGHLVRSILLACCHVVCCGFFCFRFYAGMYGCMFFFFLSLFSFLFISWRLITLQYCGFWHTLTRISHGFTCV